MATAVVTLAGDGASKAPTGGPLTAPASPTASEGPALILVTTVDIGEGRSDYIEVRQGDDPLDLARAFVKKHNLPLAITEALAQHLRDNLDEASQDQQSSGGSSQRSEQEAVDPEGEEEEGEYDEEYDEYYEEGEGEVFERLYQQAVVLREKMQAKKEQLEMEEEMAVSSTKQPMSWVSYEMMRERTSGPYQNYGEMLYAESLEGIMLRRQRAERERAERTAAELSNATFQPEISPLAQQMWSRQDSRGVPAWQRLSKGATSKSSERMEMLRKEREDAIYRECTFKPTINNRSDRLMAERCDTLRSLNVSTHQQLYQDSLRRQRKQEAYAHWYPEDATFQPRLLQSTAGNTKKKAPTDAPQQPLVERLYASYERLQHKLSEARAKLEGPVDPATGRPLYKPQTGRGPAYRRHAPQQTVCEYLYALHNERTEKEKQRKEEEAKKAAEEASKAKVDATSAAIVRKLQRKRFQQIFEYLDRGSTGTIDLAAIVATCGDRLSQLNDDVRDDVESAAKIAAKGGAGKAKVASSQVDLESFCALMEEAIAASPRPRTYLARSASTKALPSETFAPLISERSKHLAAKLRPKDTPVHEVLYGEALNITAKKEALRAVIEGEAMKECTFAPKLVAEQIVSEGRVMREVRESSSCVTRTGSQLTVDGCIIGATMRRAASATATGALATGTTITTSDAVAQGSLQELQAELEEAEAAAAASDVAKPRRKTAESAFKVQAVIEAAEGAADAKDEQSKGQSEASRQLSVGGSQFLELEREVEAMLEATSVAAAAAEKLMSRSNQQYLAKILGLTQEAVDAMQPTMSNLSAWDRSSRGGAGAPAAATDGDASAGPSQLAPQQEPLLSPFMASGAPPASAASAAKSLFSVTETQKLISELQLRSARAPPLAEAEEESEAQAPAPKAEAPAAPAPAAAAVAGVPPFDSLI